jgi:hypothetical protein
MALNHSSEDARRNLRSWLLSRQLHSNVTDLMISFCVLSSSSVMYQIMKLSA